MPEVAATTVNQGLGSYAPFVRGKDTLVRFFLRLPSCAGNRDSISITGASLTVTLGGTTLGTISAPLQSLNPPPTVARDGPRIDHSADPIFLVDGSVLAPSSTTDAFTPSFRPSLTFTSSQNSSPQTTSPPAVSAPFERRTNALRTLVVPLGDASSAVTQFTSSGTAAVQTGMSALARMFPLPDGTSASLSEGGATGGARYSINASLLDIAAVMSGGKFCGTSSAFTGTIQPLLADFRQQYNSANAGTEREADRVLGAVDEALHAGGSCAQGYAMLGSAEAYALALYSSSPSATGAIVGMETAHTFAQVDSSSPNYDPFNQAHSYRTEADATDPDRGYNVATGTYVSSDRTAMRVSDGWNGTSAILEKHEYDALRCRFGGTTSCPATTPVGTPVGVPAGPAYVVVGTTEEVLDSFATHVPRTSPAPDSSRRVVFRDAAGAELGSFGIPVLFDGSVHDDSGEPDQRVLDTGSFSVAAPLPPGTASAALVDGGAVRYERFFNNRPLVTSFTASPAGSAAFTRFTTRFGDDAQPALSPRGFVAWVATAGEDGDALFVAPAAGGDTVPVPIAGGDIRDPAWSQDGTRLAYIRDGSLYAVDVTTTAGSPEFGEPQLLRFSDAVEYESPLEDPTWSQDGTEIAFGNGFQVRVLNLETREERPLADRRGCERQPSWSATPGVDRIALVRDDCEGGDGAIVTVQPDDHGGTPPPTIKLTESFDGQESPGESVVVAGSQPSWGDHGLIAFVDPLGRLAVVDAEGGDTARALSDAAGDSSPSMHGTQIAFDRAFLDCGSELCFEQREVMIARTATELSVQVEDETPDLLRASFFTSCQDEYQPVAVAVPPASVEDGRATFLQPFTPIACEGASVFVDVNDGASRSGLTETTSDLTFGLPARPVPAVHVPVAGAEVLEGHALLAEGSASDGEDGDVDDLRWVLACGAHQRTAVGAEAQFTAPLPPGPCTLSLTATDSDGNAETTSVPVTIAADRDNDWLSDDLETTLPCFPAGAEVDGASGLVDHDGDGIPSVDDRHTEGGPCSPETSYRALVEVMPKSLNPDSRGNPVTVRVRLPARSVHEVDASTVRISNISGYEIPASDRRFVAQKWRVDGDTAIAHFARDAITELIRENGLRNRTLSLDLTGASRPTTTPSAFTFSATGFTRVLP